MKRLPLGIKTFRKIREGNYVYIDKTKEALELIENYTYVFLSRPRRFGKSLFVDTLKEIFYGNKELFKGLYIYDKYNFEEYPVIRIDLSGNFQCPENTKNVIINNLTHNSRYLDVGCSDFTAYDTCFYNLIFNAYEKYNKRVVILIDEYDKPILDVIDKPEIVRANREILRGFYSVIKAADEYIRFVFLTGVSKFSKTSIFSGLNNIVDVSLMPKFGEICGYTHEDLQEEFSKHLAGVDLEEVRRWYNGYYFLGKEKLYNPYEILNFIDGGCIFKSYWFSTGTPTFLIKLLQAQKYNPLDFEDLEIDEILLDSFDVDKMPLAVVMFQSGYLTIKEVIRRGPKILFRLYFPNMSVKISFYTFLLSYLMPLTKFSSVQEKILRTFYASQFSQKELEETLKMIFASANYFVHTHLSKFESFYAFLFYSFFAASGLDVQVESITNKGRIDLLVEAEGKAFIMEIKTDGSGALEQIKEKKYWERFLDRERIYLIGIEIDRGKKELVRLEIEAWK